MGESPDNGLALLEPVPETDELREDPVFEDWYRVPLSTVMRWEKA